VAGLRLEAVEFVDLTRWRWMLTDGSGALVAGHEVRLDALSWQFEAFTDLVGYLSWHVMPDRRAEEETQIVSAVGEWIRSEVLGPVAAALVKACPATVRVAVPEGAEELLARPLELGHVGGKPLAVQGVTLVMETGPDERGVSPVGERLRVLGLFSLPEGAQALNLRRERYSLVQLIKTIATAGKAADVRVLQYGVTRDRLRDVLADDEGWDAIHISGHGSPGQLLLETDAGKPDRVTAAQLAGLLAWAGRRLKLVTISACWSAARAVAEQRRLLGLPVQDEIATERTGRPRGAESAPGSLATELARGLGCAVLAMRYPVDDEFAIALGGKLYELLAAGGQPLPEAVGITLGALASGSDGTGSGGMVFPALSVATPALFGGSAMGLRLAAPDHGQPTTNDAVTVKMAGFPLQPERFVGRTALMTRASAALAAQSGVPGVVLHGMPGGGKSACALELAYDQEHAFDRLIWYKAPDEGMDITGALTGFALTLERYLDGFQMAHVLADENQLAAFLPRLTELTEQRRLLLVIDNAESLLSQDGQWRDQRWSKVIGALTAHTGLSRLVLTSRRVPAGLSGLGAAAVDALSADESLLLIRELPHLRDLSHGKIPGIDPQVARRLAHRALDVAQGHPKLIELAEGQAANPERLAKLVKAGRREWRKLGGLPEGFFATGKTTTSGEDYLDVLAAWTKAVTGTLTPGERDLFWFLCCLEERDRDRATLDGNWASLWTALGRDGEPPGLGKALSVLAARGLAAIQAVRDNEDESWAVHPGVAAAGRAQAGKPFQGAVDVEVSRYWASVFLQASGGKDGVTDTGLLVRAGLAEVPYLMRQEQWTAAAVRLERAFNRDPSSANASAVLPAIQRVMQHEERAAGIRARVLMAIDPAAAEREMRAYVDAAATRGDYSAASVAAMWVIDLCRRSGRLAEALALADEMIGYTRQAGHGPWTQLLDEVQRLQVLGEMGHADQVLAEVQRLRSYMSSLPATPGQDETATPWNVREMLLDIGRNAARQLGLWDDALELNAAILASKHDRSAPATDIAQAKFNDYSPLLQLDHADEALALLRECREVFQDADDIRLLGMTLTALASTEDVRGHGDAAIRMEHDALRYKYLAGIMIGIAGSYHNLGDYLRRHARQAGTALASHLAAALIRVLTGAEGTDDSVRAAAIDVREVGAAATPPTDVADLCRQLGDIPGTDLPGLLEALSPDPAAAEQALRELIAQAQALAEAPPRATTAS
jgi:tetratricopeptide (TPR) repeat protein